VTALAAVISDTGPLSHLHKLGKLDLLRSLFYMVRSSCTSVVDELEVSYRFGKNLPGVATVEWTKLVCREDRALIPGPRRRTAACLLRYQAAVTPTIDVQYRSAIT
jgi:predicted nucleic acid-binding protein